MAALLIVPLNPASSEPSSAGESNQAIVAFCRDKITNVLTANMGECMGLVATLLASSEGELTLRCDALLETDPITFYALFDSFSDCVRTSRN